MTMPSLTPDQVGAALRVALGAGVIAASAHALVTGYDSAHAAVLWVAAASGSMISTKTLLPLALLLLMLVGMHEAFFHAIAP